MQIISRLLIGLINRVGLRSLQRLAVVIVDRMAGVVPLVLVEFIRTRRRETAAIVAALLVMIVAWSSAPQSQDDGFVDDDDMSLLDELTSSEQIADAGVADAAVPDASAANYDEPLRFDDEAEPYTAPGDVAVADYGAYSDESAFAGIDAPATPPPPASALPPSVPMAAPDSFPSADNVSTRTVPSAGAPSFGPAPPQFGSNPVQPVGANGARLMGVIEEVHDSSFSTTGYSRPVNRAQPAPTSAYSPYGR